MAIQRFYEGVNSVSTDNPIGMLPYLDPTTWAVWMDDFVIIPELTSQWVNTGGLALAAGSYGGCGSLVLTQTGDNSLYQLTLKNINFTFVSGKKLIFETKFYLNKVGGTIGEQEIFFGLAGLDTGASFTAADGLTMAVDNCVGFWSPDATANINSIVRVVDVESTQNPTTTYADLTWTVLSFYFDGTSIQFYKNDVMVSKITAYPTVGLSPTIFFKAGEAQNQIMYIDYMLVARER